VFKRDELGIPGFWQLQVLGWLGFYVLVVVSCISDELKTAGVFRNNSIGLVLMFAGSWILRPICRSLLRNSPNWIACEIRAFVWSMAIGTSLALLFELTALSFKTGWGGGQWGAVEWGDVAENSVQFSVVLFLWCSLYFSIKQWQQSRRESERLLRAESEAREARLSALRYQLNPHFLFNSLNAVSTLVLEGNARAATRMLAQIGELLRTTLDAEAQPETELSHEMAFTEQYLAIEQTRLGGRLHVVVDIAPDTLGALVPSMLLQPLVENAVRHGVAPLVEGGTMCIRSNIHDDRLQIMLQNSGLPGHRFRSKNKGIGLSNTAERLKTLYGDDHKFELQWPEAGGCDVLVEIPLRKVLAKDEVLSCVP
jgi:two-component system, LytTR family, sensor kinase